MSVPLAVTAAALRGQSQAHARGESDHLAMRDLYTMNSAHSAIAVARTIVKVVVPIAIA